MARKCASEHGRIVAELLWAERLIGNPGGGVPLYNRRVHGFRFVLHHAESILTEKACLKRRRVVWQDHRCRADRIDHPNSTAG